MTSGKEHGWDMFKLKEKLKVDGEGHSPEEPMTEGVRPAAACHSSAQEVSVLLLALGIACPTKVATALERLG